MGKLFFQPEEAWVGDLIPYYEDGVYYAFYLHDPRCFKDEYAEETTWHLVTTTDFKEIRYCGEAIARGADDRPNKNAYTGSVIKDRNNVYHVFYTAFNADIKINGKSVQSVMKATGTDLYHLKTDENWIFTADDEKYESFDWRDPFVFYDEREDCYKMLLAAREKGCGELRGGCIALCRSKDLEHWSYEEPFYRPERYVTMECPELFQMGDWYYLGFSTFNDRFSTHYRKSRNPDGPWEIPEDDVYDTRANYAIKTAGHGEERYAFGWIASKKGNCDEGAWEWGGTMNFQKLLQNRENGELYVVPTEGADTYFDKTAEKGNASFYHAVQQKETLSKEAQAELGAVLYDIPEDGFELEVSLSHSGCQEFGLALHVDGEMEKGYFLRFFPKMNMVAWDRWPRRTQPGMYQWQIDGDIPYQIESQRYLPKSASYHIRLLKEDSICSVYINERIVLSTRLYDHRGQKAGVYTTQDDLIIEDLHFKTR